MFIEWMVIDNFFSFCLCFRVLYFFVGVCFWRGFVFFRVDLRRLKFFIYLLLRVFVIIDFWCYLFGWIFGYKC